MSNKVLKAKEINEFDLNFTVYNLDNKYSLEEINDMFVEWAESKHIYVGGKVSVCDSSIAAFDFSCSKKVLPTYSDISAKFPIDEAFSTTIISHLIGSVEGAIWMLDLIKKQLKKHNS